MNWYQKLTFFSWSWVFKNQISWWFHQNSIGTAWTNVFKPYNPAYKLPIHLKIWLPSGVQAHEVKARVQNGGMQVNVFTKMPCELTNTEPHRLTYQDDYGRPYFSKTDVWIVSHANAVAKLKLEANDEEIWTIMKINLPFQGEEWFFSDGDITGYHLARVNNKKNDVFGINWS